MSFGYSVGDVLAIIALANKIRKDFVGAPEQFDSIHQDVRSLSIVIQDAYANVDEMPEEHAANFSQILASCQALLHKLEGLMSKWSVISDPRKGKGMQRLWKRLRWEPDEISDLRAQITSKIMLLNAFNDQATSHDVAKLVRRSEDDDKQAMLDWISSIDYIPQQNHLVSRLQANSRRWLFDSAEYQSWEKQKGQILFCPGDPGTGKTFTTAIVLETLQEQAQDNPDVLNTFVYCTYQSPDQDFQGLISSLFRNSLQQAGNVPDIILSQCGRKRSAKQALLRDEIIRLLERFYSSFKKVTLLVDALDEIPTEVSRPFIAELLKLQKTCQLNLFVTSRHIPEIQNQFNDPETAIVEIRGSDKDIHHFLKDSIFQLPRFVARDPAFQTEIIEGVTEASSGMFLLAELHLRSLKNKKSPKALRSSLAKLSVGSNAYDSAYQDAMARVAGLGPESEALAKQALLILLFAREPLRTEDLAYALSIEPDSEAIDDENVPDIEDVAGVCAGLIIIDRESNIVRLVHKSAQEYFERNQAQLFPRASETMARLCLKYHALATSTAGFDKNIEASWPPFWRYAYINWGYHSRCAEKDKEVVKERDDKAETDRTVSNLHSVSTLAIDLLARDMAGSLDSALHEACREGRHALVELLLSVNDYDLNQPSTGASETCQNEHRVPTSGGSPNSDEDSWSEDGMTSEIEQEGDKGNSSKLAGHESDTESAGIYNHTPHVISGKRRHGPHSDKISVLLSRKRRFVADKDWKYLFTDDPEDEWTAAWIREQNLGKEFFLLIVAAENGDHTMIRILLNHGADANVVSNLGETALYIAARKGDQTTVSILLDQPAIKPDCKCWVGERSQRGEGGDVRPVWWTPLLAAAHHDRPECVRLLLDYSQRDYRDEFGRNAACVAAAAGHTEVLKELLQWSDVDVDPPAGVQGISALEMALRCEHEEAALVLIPHSDANRVGPDGDRPLNLAARARSCEAIRLLFARAAQVNARGNQGRTVLHTATMSTCKDTIGLILTHPDIDINIRDNHGYTPLMILVVTLAGMRFHRKIYQMALGSVNLLLSRPELDINARNFQGPTALGLAVSLSGFWEERNDLFDILSNHPDVDRDLIFEAMQYRWTSYASKMNREI